MLAERAAGGVVHDQKGGVILHVKVEDTHDMRMIEMGDSAGLFLKTLHLMRIGKARVEDFDSCLGAQAQMLTQIDFCKAALSQKADEPILAKLLADAISHRSVLS